MAFLNATPRSRLHSPGLCAALLLSLVFAAALHAQSIGESQLKAAFVYNFAQFVEWPADTFSSAYDPLKICVLGEDSFAGVLQEVVSGKQIAGHRLLVKPVHDVTPGGCQVLIADESQRKQFHSVLPRLKGVLTVGQYSEFLEDGGMINLTLQGGHFRFDINPDAAESQGVRISSKLMNLARTVHK